MSGRQPYKADPDAQAKVLEALAAGHGRGRREADIAAESAVSVRDAQVVAGWLARLDPADEEYPPIVVVEAIVRVLGSTTVGAAALKETAS